MKKSSCIACVVASIVVGVALACSGVVAILSYENVGPFANENVKNDASQVEQPAQENAEEDVTESDIEGLPSTVSKKTPIMYDFVNGTLGLNEDYVDMVAGNRVFIASKDDSNTIYFAWLPYNEYEDIRQVAPKFSNEPVAYTFDSVSDKDDYLNYFHTQYKASREEYPLVSVDEGDYTFTIVYFEDMITKCSTESSVDFANDIISGFKEGKMQQAIDNGLGIPTYIIREKCSEEGQNRMLENDPNNTFWDKVNYQEHIKCYKQGSKTDYIVLIPTYSKECSTATEYYPSFAVNNTDMQFLGQLDTLDAYLQKHGFESINQAIARGEHTPEREGTVNVS